MEGISEALPLWNGRGAALAYVLYLVTVALNEVLFEQAGAGVRTVFTDAAVTATSIATHESLYEFGFGLILISIASYVAAVTLFYRMFKPVNRTLALLATFWALVRIGIWSFATVFLIVPLVVLEGSNTYLSAFTPTQVQDLATTFVNLHTEAYKVGFVFEGLYWMSLGYLWFRSSFLTPAVGAFLGLAGLTYMVFLSRPLASELLVPVGAFSTLAELTMVIWLTVKGVNIRCWIERAIAAGVVADANRDPALPVGSQPGLGPSGAGVLVAGYGRNPEPRTGMVSEVVP